MRMHESHAHYLRKTPLEFTQKSKSSDQKSIDNRYGSHVFSRK